MPCRPHRPDLQYVAAMRKDEDAVQTVPAAVAELWLKGASIKWHAPAAAISEPGEHDALLAVSAEEACARSLGGSGVQRSAPVHIHSLPSGLHPVLLRVVQHVAAVGAQNLAWQLHAVRSGKRMGIPLSLIMAHSMASAWPRPYLYDARGGRLPMTAVRVQGQATA